MIRIGRDILDECISAFIKCAQHAANTQGLRIRFPLDADQAEAAVLGALSIVAPGGGPVTAADVFFVSGFGTGDYQSWPQKQERENGNRTN